jgi:large subunit ribosomal protein L25
MEKIVIYANRRDVIGKQVNALRREGKLPGIMYGHRVEPMPIVMNLRDAARTLFGLTASSLITVDVDGKEHSALVREIQRDYIRGTLLHIDFQVVSLTETIRTTVPIELTGTSPAVKEYDAVVVAGLAQLDVEALPQNLPDRISIDVSSLTEIGDAIYVRDLVISEDVKFTNDPDEMVAVVNPVAQLAEIEGEEEALAEAAEEPEVIERGKQEEEEEEE